MKLSSGEVCVGRPTLLSTFLNTKVSDRVSEYMKHPVFDLKAKKEGRNAASDRSAYSLSRFSIRVLTSSGGDGIPSLIGEEGIYIASINTKKGLCIWAHPLFHSGTEFEVPTAILAHGHLISIERKHLG